MRHRPTVQFREGIGGTTHPAFAAPFNLKCSVNILPPELSRSSYFRPLKRLKTLGQTPYSLPRNWDITVVSINAGKRRSNNKADRSSQAVTTHQRCFRILTAESFLGTAVITSVNTRLHRWKTNFMHNKAMGQTLPQVWLQSGLASGMTSQIR